MKQSYIKLGLVVLLLVTLLTTLGVLVYAEDTENYLLTVNYDDGCETVYYSYDGGAQQAMTSGTSYKIPKTATNVKLELKLKRGYELESATGNKGSDYFERSNVYNYGVGFTSDDTITVTSVEKTYRISYLDSPEGSYHLEGSQPTHHTFGQTDTHISLPTLAGYHFRGWIILPTATTDPSTVTDRLTPASGADYVVFPSQQTPEGDTIYLMPAWEEKEYPVYRVDVIYSGDPNFPYQTVLNANGDKWDEKANVRVTGADGTQTLYPGYYFDEETTLKYSITVKPYEETDSDRNVVYRYYRPYEYRLDYFCEFGGSLSFANDASVPEKHVFNAETLIPNPNLKGYSFAGWKVEVYTAEGKWVEVKDQSCYFDYEKGLLLLADKPSLASHPNEEGDRVIHLTARWAAEKYDVTFDWNGAEGVEFDVSKYSVYTYDTDLVMPDPVRKGYTFNGWLLTCGDEYQNLEIKSVDGTTVLTAKTYIGNIKLVAQWTPNVYNVTVDINGGTAQGTDGFTVTYDAAMKLPDNFVFPKRTGYTFAGFSLDKEGAQMYTDANGVPLTAYPAWTIDADTTLYAQWTINQYRVTVNVENATVSIVVNGETYSYDPANPMSFDYATAIKVVITSANGYKLVKWEDQTIAHSAVYEYTFVLGAEDTVLDGVVLKVIEAPTFKIDYLEETIITVNGVIPDGHYRITCGEETLDVVVSGGKIRINGGEQLTKITVPEAYFGKTVGIVTYGSDGVTADSDVQSIAIAARPSAPEANNGKEIESVYQHEDTAIVIQIKDGIDINLYEFACSESNDGTGLIWKSVAELTNSETPANGVMFTGLKPGAEYYVYVREKAIAESHPHGKEICIKQETRSQETLEAKKRELMALLKDTDGEMTKALIDRALEEANSLQRPAPDFYSKLEAIYNRVVAEIVFTREQDARLAELKALHDSLVNSGAFNTEGTNTINTLYGIGRDSIKSATASEDVQKAYNKALTEMKAVLITYLFHGDLELISAAGLPQGTKLFGSLITGIDGLTESVNSAIGAGKIAMNGSSMTLAEAVEALRTLEVMSAYQMKLTDSENALYTEFNGKYEIRLLLPAELRHTTGLQVAYYDEKTGVLEVLDTEKDGNCLVFYADRIADFVILGDPTLNLTGFIVALGLILCCQLIAIILLLVRRAKYAKHVRRYSVMIPMMLTIRFLPTNGKTLVLVLGGLVVLFQIILMYLLLSSEVIYRRRHRKMSPAEPEVPAQPVMASADDENFEETALEDTDGDPTAVFVTETADVEDETFTVDAEIDDSDAEMGDEDGVYADDTEESPVVESEDSAEEAFDDFIEPAANPRYSLPDDEEEEMYVDTETGELYSAADIAQAEAEGVQFTYDDGEDEPSGKEDTTDTEPADESVSWEYDDTAVSAELTDDPAFAEDEVGEQTSDALDEVDTQVDGEVTVQEDSDEEIPLPEDEDAPAENAEETDEADAPLFYEEPDACGDAAPLPEGYRYRSEDDQKS